MNGDSVGARARRISGWGGALAAVFLAAAGSSPAAENKPAPGAAVYGMTFSHRELRGRGLDWRKALDAADSLGMRFVRIGVYWSDVERSEGRFDFSELDDLLARLQRKGYKALVTVGMKAPRWPEFYIPPWAFPKTHNEKNAEVSKDPELRKRTLRFIEEAVRHLSPSPAIAAWQVENEPMDRSGEKRWFIGADFLAQEADLVRRHDRARRPLVVNCWSDDQLYASAPWTDGSYAVRNALAIGDILGLDVYPRVGKEQVFYKRRTIGLPTRYLGWAKSKGKKAWIVESQAEPWPPASYDAEAMGWLVDRHLEQGYKVILLWGFEWWYEGHLRGDDSLWKSVRFLPLRQTLKQADKTK